MRIVVWLCPVENLLATCGVGVIDPVVSSANLLKVLKSSSSDRDPYTIRGEVGKL